MADGELHVVTGAYGYSGQHIARRLLEQGHAVKTLTGSVRRHNPFGESVPAEPLCFDDPPRLAASLSGATVLYNTYWVRYDMKGISQLQAVENTLTLFRAACEAGVARIVHISMTNPSENSPFGYFRYKAIMERELKRMASSWAIVRPALLFGGADILVNNIAWMLRHLPVFGVFGDGRYRLRPVHVDDLARVAVDAGAGTDNVVVDAVGPERFEFREFVRAIGDIIGRRRPIVRMPTRLALAFTRALGWMVGDVILTGEEVRALMAGLLDVDGPATGKIRLTDWARSHADALGRRYASELARRRNRALAYHEL